jgi:hypothetical protein
MHDPMHVVLELRRPWPKKWTSGGRRYEPNRRRRHRQFGPLNIRAAEHRCAHCDEGRVTDPPPSYHEHEGHRAGEKCPNCAGRGYNRNPFWRRPYFGWAFWQFGSRQYYFPGLVTLWHVDPETDGSDSSCRNRYKPHWRAAHADNDPLRKWFWWKVMVHYDKWHVHHWKLQIKVWQDFNRWAWSRCAHCRGRFRWGYSPVSHSWHGTGPRWRRGEEGIYHYECSAAASSRNQPPDHVASGTAPLHGTERDA